MDRPAKKLKGEALAGPVDEINQVIQRWMSEAKHAVEEAG